jgi:hypothetical protein
MELRIVGPTVDDEWGEKFKVQPQVEPIFGCFITKVVHSVGFVEFGVDLASSIAGNCGRQSNE